MLYTVWSMKNKEFENNTKIYNSPNRSEARNLKLYDLFKTPLSQTASRTKLLRGKFEKIYKLDLTGSIDFNISILQP